MVGRVALLLAPSAVMAVTLKNSNFDSLVSLLKEIQAENQEELQSERVAWAKYDTWYKNFKDESDGEISSLGERIDTHNGNAAEAEAQIATYGKNIGDAQNEVVAKENEIKSEKGFLQQTRDECAASKHDYEKSIDALERALNVLRTQADDTDKVGLSSLLQLDNVPAQAKQALLAFLQDDEADEASVAEAGDAYAYEFQSGGIVQMVEELGDKFTDELRAHETGCSNMKSASELAIQDLLGVVENTNAQIKRWKSALGKSRQAMGFNNQQAAELTATLTDTQKALDEATRQYTSNKQTYDGNQESRLAEVGSVKEALDIFTRAVFLQSKAGTALVQMKSYSKSPMQEQILDILSRTKDGEHQDTLQLITQSVRAGGLDKVTDLIKGLIERLVETGRDEATHHSTCTKEMATNKALLGNAQETYDSEKNKLETATAQIAQSNTDEERFQQDITSTTEEQNTLTKDRSEESTANRKDLEEHDSFIQMLQDGIKALQKYYADNNADTLIQAEEDVESASLLQQTGPAFSPYSGNQKTGSVLDLLQNIEVDERAARGELQSQEDTAADQYKEIMHDIEIKLTKLDLNAKNSKKLAQKATSDKLVAEDALKNAGRLVESQEKAKTQLHKACDRKVYTVEERAAARQKEIDSLKEVLAILK